LYSTDFESSRSVPYSFTTKPSASPRCCDDFKPSASPRYPEMSPSPESLFGIRVGNRNKQKV
jgi:hypothetical protein